MAGIPPFWSDFINKLANFTPRVFAIHHSLLYRLLKIDFFDNHNLQKNVEEIFDSMEELSLT